VADKLIFIALEIALVAGSMGKYSAKLDDAVAPEDVSGG
jgi:hypothetical protein